jgi:xanthine/uracil/vitamin C permease (AzgA family)
MVLSESIKSGPAAGIVCLVVINAVAEKAFLAQVC